MSDRQWHYAAGGASVGPRTARQMQALIGQGDVTAGTLVWSEGMAQWAQAGATELRGFFGGPAATPPPMPAAAPAAGAAPAVSAASAGPAPWMGFAEAVRYCLRNYVKFSGRGSRSQYWFFTLFLVMVNFAIGLIDMAFGLTAAPIGVGGMVLMTVSIAFSLGTLLPSLAAASRRLHDAGWSFWWCLTLLVPLAGALFVLYLCVIRDPRPNRFDAA